MAADVASFKCNRCDKPAKLQCPKCQQLKLDKAASAFCSQDCFKESWPEHRKVHQPGPGAWLYCAQKGRGRTQAPPEFAWTGDLRPHPISPTRPIPPHIRLPEWAEGGIPEAEQASKQQRIAPCRTEREVRGIREACRLGREILDAAHAAVAPGVTTDEIDRVVHEETLKRNAYPSPLNYFHFPKSVCTSVNEVICHGIPDSRPLQNGDIINIDVSCYYKGFHGDLNETYVVGEADPESKRLVKATHDALMAAIAAVKPGLRYRQVGDVISGHLDRQRFSVVRTYCGHGIGDHFHCHPSIPHYANNKTVGVMKEGQTFTIEPMVNAGTWRDVTWPDGWTSATVDGARSAQFEHTLLVTATGCEILTARLPTSPPLWWEREGEQGENPASVQSELGALSVGEAQNGRKP